MYRYIQAYINVNVNFNCGPVEQMHRPRHTLSSLILCINYRVSLNAWKYSKPAHQKDPIGISSFDNPYKLISRQIRENHSQENTTKKIGL